MRAVTRHREDTGCGRRRGGANQNTLRIPYVDFGVSSLTPQLYLEPSYSVLPLISLAVRGHKNVYLLTVWLISNTTDISQFLDFFTEWSMMFLTLAGSEMNSFGL